MDYNAESILKHKEWRGKIEVISRAPTENRDDLSVAYTPGVAQPCREIAADRDLVYDYTRKGNLVAVVTDGSAVLGLGNIGAEAGYPVMEGKCVLFKNFADVDAVPICLATQDTEEIIRTVKNIAPTFGGINLEDISAPRCFEIEDRLKAELDIPVFHDDQHGTAVVCCAAMINALKIVNKSIGSVSVVISGAGAAGISVARMLLLLGAKDIVVCDSKGAIHRNMPGLTGGKASIVEVTNHTCKSGSLVDVLAGADVFIGVSAPDILTEADVATMNTDAIVFALSNPVPEIMPDRAKAAGARVVGTGRSDFPNQINNVLAFPGIFRGALDARASQITEEMKVAAAEAIAGLVGADELREDYIIPKPLDKRVAAAVAKAVQNA